MRKWIKFRLLACILLGMIMSFPVLASICYLPSKGCLEGVVSDSESLTGAGDTDDGKIDAQLLCMPRNGYYSQSVDGLNCSSVQDGVCIGYFYCPGALCVGYQHDANCTESEGWKCVKCKHDPSFTKRVETDCPIGFTAGLEETDCDGKFSISGKYGDVTCGKCTETTDEERCHDLYGDDAVTSIPTSGCFECTPLKDGDEPLNNCYSCVIYGDETWQHVNLPWTETQDSMRSIANIQTLQDGTWCFGYKGCQAVNEYLYEKGHCTNGCYENHTCWDKPTGFGSAIGQPGNDMMCDQVNPFPCIPGKICSGGSCVVDTSFECDEFNGAIDRILSCMSDTSIMYSAAIYEVDLNQDLACDIGDIQVVINEMAERGCNNTSSTCENLDGMIENIISCMAGDTSIPLAEVDLNKDETCDIGDIMAVINMMAELGCNDKEYTCDDLDGVIEKTISCMAGDTSIPLSEVDLNKDKACNIGDVMAAINMLAEFGCNDKEYTCENFDFESIKNRILLCMSGNTSIPLAEVDLNKDKVCNIGDIQATINIMAELGCEEEDTPTAGINQLATLIRNIRTYYADADDYSTLDSINQAQFYPEGMTVGRTIWGTPLDISVIDSTSLQVKNNGDHKGFWLQFPLPDEACVELVQYDWKSEGVKYVSFYETPGVLETPISASDARTYCVGVQNNMDGIELDVIKDDAVSCESDDECPDGNICSDDGKCVPYCFDGKEVYADCPEPCSVQVEVVRQRMEAILSAIRNGESTSGLNTTTPWGKSINIEDGYLQIRLPEDECICEGLATTSFSVNESLYEGTGSPGNYMIIYSDGNDTMVSGPFAAISPLSVYEASSFCENVSEDSDGIELYFDADVMAPDIIKLINTHNPLH